MTLGKGLYLCGLAVCDTLKKMGKESDYISNMDTGSKDETLKAKSGCDTTRTPCHQLLVAGEVLKL